MTILLHHDKGMDVKTKELITEIRIFYKKNAHFITSFEMR